MKIAREEKLFPLTAVILNYIGDTFQAQGEIQDAVIAYEAALQALESENTLKVESVIDRLSQVPKGFYSNPAPVPDLYSAETAATLEAEANDPALPIKLCLDIRECLSPPTPRSTSLKCLSTSTAISRNCQQPITESLCDRQYWGNLSPTE